MSPGAWKKAALCAAVLVTAACDINFNGGGDSSAGVQPSDWWKCPQRLSGSWAFGRAPFGCDVGAFTEPAVVRLAFTAYIFNDDAARDTERLRYMQAFHSFLGDGAAVYLRSRRPDASDAEVAAWQHAVFATAQQESFWTHYRDATTSDGPLLTMLRGDNGHGHGLMQIDDRYHTDAIQSGVGWRLDENLVYALDIYYDGWQRAPQQWCVSAPDAWAERARAAYSAYNGGPAQICRWTNPDSPWHANDEGFYNKYIQRQWQSYVAG